MALFAYPLQSNTLRDPASHNAFGNIRNGGTRPHQGWDLIAQPMTPCYAIADGTIEYVGTSGDFGTIILLEFEYRGRPHYAAYCHLSFYSVDRHQSVSRSDLIGHTGNSGNAKSMRGEDQHLHFEVRTLLFPGRGLTGRIDPAELYGRAILSGTVYQNHGPTASAFGSGVRSGIRLPGINVLD